MSAQEMLNSFLDQTVEAAELNTEYKLCPEIESAPAIIEDVTFNSGSRASKDGEAEEPWVSAQFKYKVDSQEAREELGRDTVIVSGSPLFLNFEKDGTLSVPNNQPLARMVKLCGIEIQGLSVRQIFECFKGQPVTVKVTHRALTKDKQPLLDEEGNQRYMAEVSGVGPA